MPRRFQFSLGNLFVALFVIAAAFAVCGHHWPLISVGVAWCVTWAVSWVIALRPQFGLLPIFRLTTATAAFCGACKMGVAIDLSAAIAILYLFAASIGVEE